MSTESVYRTQFLLFRTLSNFLLIAGAVFLFFSLGPSLRIEFWYRLQQLRGASFALDAQAKQIGRENFSPFAYLLSKYPPIRVEPVSRDYSIVIEKIGVNAPIVEGVDVAQRSEYFEALRRGVAAAKGSAAPGAVGNTYLFAHSALDFWNFGEYATVFNLLRELTEGDRVVVFYRGQRYDYVVFNKEIFKGFDTTPLTRTFAEPVLTLQTCDPPGTALNRLVITAKLVKVGY